MKKYGQQEHERKRIYFAIIGLLAFGLFISIVKNNVVPGSADGAVRAQTNEATVADGPYYSYIWNSNVMAGEELSSELLLYKEMPGAVAIDKDSLLCAVNSAYAAKELKAGRVFYKSDMSEDPVFTASATKRAIRIQLEGKSAQDMQNYRPGHYVNMYGYERKTNEQEQLLQNMRILSMSRKNHSLYLDLDRQQELSLRQQLKAQHGELLVAAEVSPPELTIAATTTPSRPAATTAAPAATTSASATATVAAAHSSTKASATVSSAAPTTAAE